MLLLYFNKKNCVSSRRVPVFCTKLIALAIILCSNLLFAADTVEYKIKAAYLYNFTKFITWPEFQSETFNLCILGKDPFGSLIESIESREALGLPIKLVRMRRYDASKKCHLLFLGSATRKDTRELIASSGILTVSEKQHFAKYGGMIGFVIKEGKVKLQINLAKLKESGLEISAKLLEIVEIIGGNGDG
jgi:hypothetical protein